jgi:hypothetical protein
VDLQQVAPHVPSVAYRLSGLLWSMRCTTAARRIGTSGTRVRIESGSSETIWYKTPCRVLALNGFSMVRNS